VVHLLWAIVVVAVAAAAAAVVAVAVVLSQSCQCFKSYDGTSFVIVFDSNNINKVCTGMLYLFFFII
jgi:hypothetical protein